MSPEQNVFGLCTADMDEIISILKSHPSIERAVIFGSRALQTYKRGSDVDIALFGKQIEDRVVTSISYTLNEEGLLPYFFDVLDYNSIANVDLKKHIDRVGIVFYTRLN